MMATGRFSTRSSGPAAAVAAVGLLWCSAVTAQAPRPLIPERVTLSPAGWAALNAEWLTDDERRQLHVFHGVWDERDLDTPTRRAMAALNAWDFDDPALAERMGNRAHEIGVEVYTWDANARRTAELYAAIAG